MVVVEVTAGEVVPRRWDEGAYHHGPPSHNHLQNTYSIHILIIMHKHLVSIIIHTQCKVLCCVNFTKCKKIIIKLSDTRMDRI